MPMFDLVGFLTAAFFRLLLAISMFKALFVFSGFFISLLLLGFSLNFRKISSSFCQSSIALF